MSGVLYPARVWVLSDSKMEQDLWNCGKVVEQEAGGSAQALGRTLLSHQLALNTSPGTLPSENWTVPYSYPKPTIYSESK